MAKKIVFEIIADSDSTTCLLYTSYILYPIISITYFETQTVIINIHLYF